jgi:hypothetical protein
MCLAYLVAIFWAADLLLPGLGYGLKVSSPFNCHLSLETFRLEMIYWQPMGLCGFILRDISTRNNGTKSDAVPFITKYKDQGTVSELAPNSGFPGRRVAGD